MPSRRTLFPVTQKIPWELESMTVTDVLLCCTLSCVRVCVSRVIRVTCCLLDVIYRVTQNIKSKSESLGQRKITQT